MIRTRRWNDPKKEGDGFRLLVCRYRPRGVKTEDETWDAWDPNLGPSKALHGAYFGKTGAPPIGWDEYRARYLEEMQEQTYRLTALANRVRNGETITLLCSSHCTDENQCHRTLLAHLIDERVRK
jgi:uncharacterized protein YeaO (DUF488 family)